MGSLKTISVVIPTYNRPLALARCIKPLLQAPVDEIIIVDDSAYEVKEMNKRLIESANNGFHSKIQYIAHDMRTSAPIARNKGIHIAQGDIVLLLDDDMVLASNQIFQELVKIYEMYPDVGVICGRIIEDGQSIVDPPFYLNVWFADYLSMITGFVFLNVGSSIRLAEYGTSVMTIRREALNGVHYHEQFKGTHYREETDFQQQCKSRGWKLLFFPMLTVTHYGTNQGGGRGQGLRERMYWKARNHTIYVKRNFKFVRRYWYFINGLLILFLYSPASLMAILKGFKDGQATV